MTSDPADARGGGSVGVGVSVVVPVRDRAYCVAEAVHSTLAQTHPEIECIVVDDGSTDGSAAVVRDGFGDDPRVRVVVQEPAGISAARNRGLAHASGRFVTFLDSDDLMVPHRIERQLACLAGGAADAVMGRQQSVLVGDAAFPAWLQRHPEWWNGYYHTSILVETRHVLAVGGFDETLTVGEDIDLVVRLAGTGVRVAQLDETIVTRRFFGDNVTYGIETDDHSALLGAIRRLSARRRAATGG